MLDERHNKGMRVVASCQGWVLFPGKAPQPRSITKPLHELPSYTIFSSCFTVTPLYPEFFLHCQFIFCAVYPPFPYQLFYSQTHSSLPYFHRFFLCVHIISSCFNLLFHIIFYERQPAIFLSVHFTPIIFLRLFIHLPNTYSRPLSFLLLISFTSIFQQFFQQFSSQLLLRFPTPPSSYPYYSTFIPGI